VKKSKALSINRRCRNLIKIHSKMERELNIKGNKLLVKGMGYSNAFNLGTDKKDVMSIGDIMH
jgi:hypothetical protein